MTEDCLRNMSYWTQASVRGWQNAETSPGLDLGDVKKLNTLVKKSTKEDFPVGTEGSTEVKPAPPDQKHAYERRQRMGH